MKIGVLGAGHLGKIHIKLIKELTEDYELVGFFDPSTDQSAAVSKEYGIKQFPTIDALIDEVDVVDVVTPTLSHYECASNALKKSKHVFIEKPITNTLKEAKSLIRLTEEADVKVQVGHVERFNPAFTSARSYFKNPMFIETHRLAQFNPRGTDVSVVLDLMIHDIDIILSVVSSNIKRISASGVAVVSDTPDIANARIEFDNGCVANLTASRISMKNMRKSRFFQRDAYISLDFYSKEVEVVRINDAQKEEDPYAVVLELKDGLRKQVEFEKPDVKVNNAIKDELKAFSDAIQKNTTPSVTIEDGYNALSVAHQIMEKLKLTSSLIEER